MTNKIDTKTRLRQLMTFDVGVATICMQLEAALDQIREDFNPEAIDTDRLWDEFYLELEEQLGEEAIEEYVAQCEKLAVPVDNCYENLCKDLTEIMGVRDNE